MNTSRYQGWVVAPNIDPYPYWTNTQFGWAVGWACGVAAWSGSWLLGTISAALLLGAWDDVRRNMIPDRAVLGGALSVLVQMIWYLVQGETYRVQWALFVVAVSFVVFSLWGMAKGMGGGDIKIMALVIMPCWAMVPQRSGYDASYLMSNLLLFYICVGAVAAGWPVLTKTSGDMPGGGKGRSWMANSAQSMVVMGPAFFAGHVLTTWLVTNPPF